MKQVQLEEITSFVVTGEDAETFLQGQLTCDLKDLSADKPLIGAHCNLQGRIVSLYQVIKKEDSIRLLLSKDMVEEALSHLKKYAAFSKVTIEKSTDKIVAQFDEITEKLNFLVCNSDEKSSDINEYYAYLIHHKIPQLIAVTQSHFLPAELNLAGLGAVSLNKGCYLGQEVIARMHYLGKLKKQLLKTQVTGIHSLAWGDKIEQNGKTIAECVMAIQTEKGTWLSLMVVSDKFNADQSIMVGNQEGQMHEC